MKIGFRNLALAACLLAGLGGFAASPSSGLDSQSYLKHLKFLTSDALQGRGNGTPELDKAAEYIAGEFGRSGLLPAGDPGSYFQSFQVAVGHELGPNNKLTIRIGGETIEAAMNRDFMPYALGEKAQVKGPVAFAGYGIFAEGLLLWALRPNLKKLVTGQERVVKYSLNGWLRARKAKRAESQNAQGDSKLQ
jgi:hypothetical protein